MNIFFEIFMILGILILLFTINKEISLIVFSLLFLFLLIFFLLNKKSFKTFGISLNQRYTNRLETIREMIDGIKEINLYDKANFTRKKFHNHNNRISSLTAKLALKDILPKNLIEPLAVLIITVVISLLILDGKNTNEILPMLAIIGVCFVKFAPSIGKILSSLQRIRQSEPYVKDLNTIFDNLENIKINKNIKIELNKDIRFENVNSIIMRKIFLKD